MPADMCPSAGKPALPAASAPAADRDLTDPAVLPFGLEPDALQGSQETLHGDTLLRVLPGRL